MDRYTFLVGSGFAFVTAGIYAFVGRQLWQRDFEDPGVRTAHMLFIVWWFGLASSTLIRGLGSLLGYLGVTDLYLHVTLTHLNLLAICLSLWGLLYYLVYLFTGSRAIIAPLTIAYILYYAFVVYFVTASEPIGVAVDQWRTTLVYGQPLRGPLFTGVLLLLVFPQILGGLAYFSLFFRVDTPTQKYRIAMVSWSIIIWFSLVFVATITRLSVHTWWQIASQLIGLAAALTILMAYYPMGWVKRRYGIASIREETAWTSR